MSSVPEFHFDFGPVQGLPFEEGAEALFRQMEAHYNEHIRPKPYIFGADFAKPGSDRSSIQLVSTPKGDSDAKQMRDDFEIKPSQAVGLKPDDGYFLTGVTSDGVEVFDKIVTPAGPPWPLIVEGESAKYNLGTDPNA